MRGLILLFIATTVQASVVSVPAPRHVEELDLTQIEADMRTAGHGVVHTICGGAPAKCAVMLSAGNPAPADLAPFFAAAKTRTQKKAEAAAREAALLSKLDAGTATQAEIAEVLRSIKTNR